MRKTIGFIIMLAFLIQVAGAAEVCVVADFGGEAEDEPRSKCVDIDEGKNGYELLEEIGWSLLWTPETAYGHMLCKIEGVGTDVSGNYCAYDGKFWNLVLAREGEWLHMPVGIDGPGGCWNYDVNSWNGHYCTEDGDVLGFAFGPAGAKPQMFIVNASKIYVDGGKLRESKIRGGKIDGVFPGSDVKIKIELENLYDFGTEIDIEDVSIEARIEEIDDGDDMEFEMDGFDLNADKKTTKEVEFVIPLEVDAKDRLLVIELDAEDSAGIKYEKKFTFDLEIEKDGHKLEIIKAELNKGSYTCGENALVGLSILNIGDNDENVALRIVNEGLGLDLMEDFELGNEAFEESIRFEKRISIRIPDRIDKTAYPLRITAGYSGKEETKEINLVVDECNTKKSASIGEESDGTGESKGIADVNTQVKLAGDSDGDGIESEKGRKSSPALIEEIGEDKSGMGVILIAVLSVLIVIMAGLAMVFFVVKR